MDAAKFAGYDPVAGAALRARFGIPADDRLLTFVGRIGLEKNLDLLVEAFSHVEQPNARLLVVGHGPYRSDLDEHVAALGITDRVTFTGYLERPDVATALGTSDLLFFEPLTHEDVLNICERLNGKPLGQPGGYLKGVIVP